MVANSSAPALHCFGVAGLPRRFVQPCLACLSAPAGRESQLPTGTCHRISSEGVAMTISELACNPGMECAKHKNFWTLARTVYAEASSALTK